jgi:competence protein ComFC
MYVLNIKTFNDFADLLFPRFCPLCGKRLKATESICHECAKKIEPITYREKPKGKWFFDEFFYRAPYNGVMGELVKIYKFTPRPSLAAFLADELMRVLERFNPPKNSVLTYVPPTFESLKEKGFNHMKIIAKRLSAKSGLPFYTLLEVKSQRRYQVGFSRVERQKLVASKYDVLVEKLYQTSGNVVLIDDVFTTGATVNECSRLLKNHGASKVWVYTLTKS